MKDKEAFKRYMLGLGEVFNREISQILMDIYWKTLESFSDDKCERAFNQAISNSKFFPKPAELLEIIRGTQEDRAMLAWLSVEKAIRGIGPYSSVQFEDPVIHSVIESLDGWPEFQNFTNAERQWKQREFVVRYRALSGKSEHPPYLPGITEADNSFRGYDDFIEPPVKVPSLQSGTVRPLDAPKEEGKTIDSPWI